MTRTEAGATRRTAPVRRTLAGVATALIVVLLAACGSGGESAAPPTYGPSPPYCKALAVFTQAMLATNTSAIDTSAGIAALQTSTTNLGKVVDVVVALAPPAIRPQVQGLQASIHSLQTSAADLAAGAIDAKAFRVAARSTVASGQFGDEMKAVTSAAAESCPLLVP